MTVYYVENGGSDGNTGEGTGPSNAWATPGHAAQAATATDGNLVYIKAGSYPLSSAVGGPGGPMEPSSNGVVFAGYETSPGDDCPTNNYPVIDANGNAPSQLLAMTGSYAKTQMVRCVIFDGDSQAINGIEGGNPNNNTVSRLVLQNFSGSYAMTGGSADRTLVTGCDANGFNIVGRLYACRATGNTGYGIKLNQSQSDQAAFCISDQNGGAGFASSTYSRLSGCISYKNQSDGFILSPGTSILEHCVSANDLGYAFNTTADCILIGCTAFSPSSGRLNLAPRLDVELVNGTGTLTENPWIDPDNGDFNLNNLAGGGAVLRGVSFDL